MYIESRAVLVSVRQKFALSGQACGTPVSGSGPASAEDRRASRLL